MTTACIFGVGAIGGYLAARLALSGVKVTGIARGAQLEAIKARGLTLIEQGRRGTVPVRAVATPQEAGPQEVVFLTLKSTDLPVVAPEQRPLLGADTAVVTVGNGFPWWYFFRAGPGGSVNPLLASVDPRGALGRLVGPEHAIGCVVYPAARVVVHPFTLGTTLKLNYVTLSFTIISVMRGFRGGLMKAYVSGLPGGSPKS